MPGDETNVEGTELTPESQEPEGTAEAATDQPQAQEPAKTPGELELEKKLEETNARYQELETNYKAMQRNLEQARRTGTLDTELRKVIEELQENQAAILDRFDDAELGIEPQEKPQSSKSRVAQLREQRAAKESAVQRQESAKAQMRTMLELSGVDINTAAKHTDPARIAMMEGRYEEAVHLFGQGLRAAKRAPAAPAAQAAPQNPDSDIEERVNLKVLQILKDKGLLDVETGGATAGAGTDTEFLRRYSSPDFEPSAADHERARKLARKELNGG